MLTASSDKTAIVWDVRTGKELLKLDRFDRGMVESVVCRNNIWLWDVTTGEELFKLEAGEKGFYRSVGFLPDGQIVGIYRRVGGRGPSKLVWGLLDTLRVDVVSPDGKILKTVSFDNFIDRISDVDTGRAVISFRGSDFEFIFSPDGKTPAPNNWSTIHLWDVATGDQIFPLYTGIAWVQSVAFSPDGKTLAAGGR